MGMFGTSDVARAGGARAVEREAASAGCGSQSDLFRRLRICAAQVPGSDHGVHVMGSLELNVRGRIQRWRRGIAGFSHRLFRVLATLPAAFLLIAGCSSGSTEAVAASSGPTGRGVDQGSGQEGRAATFVSAKPLSSQLTTATVTDPSLNNMTAATLTIPAGWKLQGITMMIPCTPAPAPVFRAYSPDGLMQYRGEPLIGWRWDSSGRPSNSGCAPISAVLSAADFLKYYVETMQGGVHVVGPMPVADVFSQWAQANAAQATQMNAHLPAMAQARSSADTAALRVQVRNGSFVIEERLRVAVQCAVRTNPGPMNGGSCSAHVEVLMAPQGKLDALVQLVDSNNLPHGVPTPEWKQAIFQRLSENNAREGAEIMAQGRQQSQAFSNMMYSAFQQNMARSAAQHAAFMQQQESSFRSSMNTANAAMNARSTAASDWVDYALDQQTVTGAGGTMKVSSAYSQTWSDGQGQWYQTNNPNANPNGVLQGNWTPTTQVHGNGQP